MATLAIALACTISHAFVQVSSGASFPGRIPFKPEILPEILPYAADRLAKFFPPTDTEDGQQKLRITNIGEFSMASPEVANRISETILSYFPTKASLTITDVNGNMGGNTLSFSKHFAKVNTMEILPLHCDVLKTNLAQFGHSTNVKVHCADYLDLMDDLQQDIIYFDPPWVREDYLSNKSSIELYLDNVNLVDIVNALLDRAQLIAIWAPNNYNIAGFASNVKSKPLHIHEVKFNDSQKSSDDTSSHLIILGRRVVGEPTLPSVASTSASSWASFVRGPKYADVFHTFMERYIGDDGLIRETNKAMESLPTKFNMLDFGAGTGHTISLLKAFNGGTAPAYYRGVEPNPQHYKILDAYLKTVGSLHYDLVSSPVEDVDVESGTYHMVFISHSLYFMSDRDLVFRKAVQALAPGGFIVVIIDTTTGNFELNHEFGYHHRAGHPHSVSSSDVLEVAEDLGLETQVTYDKYNLDLTGLLEGEADETLGKIISFVILENFFDLPKDKQHAMVNYIRTKVTYEGERLLWPKTQAHFVLRKNSPSVVPTQMQQTSELGDYTKQHEYAKVNNELWYSKYGLIPSVIHYLAPHAKGKVIKDFGCARGDISLQILQATSASHLYGFTLFDNEVQGSKKIAEGKPATFTQHDCSVVKRFGQEAPVVYSLWMLNNAKTKDMFVRMCQTMLVNTEPDGVGLFLVHVAESVKFEATSASQDFELLKVESFPTEDRLLGVVVEKVIWLGSESIFMRDHCYPRKLVLKWIREAGWTDVEQVPTLPLSTDEFGDPKEAAAYIDKNHYSIFMARKPGPRKEL